MAIMSCSKRMVLLGVVTAVAASLWGCRAAEPIKVPLVITAIPDDVWYLSASPVDKAPVVSLDDLYEQNPTGKLMLGGVEYIVRVESKTTWSGDNNPRHVLRKLFLKTPTQEFTTNLVDDNTKESTKPVELTFDSGRKYFLKCWGSYYNSYDAKTQKIGMVTHVRFRPAGVQTGKIPPSQTPIAIFDSNVDGFYTSDEDGIVVGSPAGFGRSPGPYKFIYAQPFSKYITTPPPVDGIFEIQNLAKDGSELTVIPYRGPTAKLQIITPKNYAGQIILTSDVGLNVTVDCKVDGVGESVTVIPGGYTIMNAWLSVPMQDSESLAPLMSITGEGMPILKVEPGAKQVLILNGPTAMDFQAAMVDGKVNIKSDTLHIKGQAGETYVWLPYDYENPPEVYLNVDGQSMLLGKMEFG